MPIRTLPAQAVPPRRPPPHHLRDEIQRLRLPNGNDGPRARPRILGRRGAYHVCRSNRGTEQDGWRGDCAVSKGRIPALEGCVRRNSGMAQDSLTVETGVV